MFWIFNKGEGYIIEGAIYTTIIFLSGLYFSRKYPSKPILSFIATSILALTSHVFYWQQEWDLSTESFFLDVNRTGESIMVFTLSYMLADLPTLLFSSINAPGERIMYSVHHAVAAISLILSIQNNTYQRYMFFLLTCEATNILLNLRKVVNSPLSDILDIVFVFAFFGYRMYYLFPKLMLFLYELYFLKGPYDVFVLNIGPLVIGLLHIYWSYLIIVEVCKLFAPKPKVKNA